MHRMKPPQTSHYREAKSLNYDPNVGTKLSNWRFQNMGVCKPR